MNASLARSAARIGHRVWQSVEYYMANYPDTAARRRQQEKARRPCTIAFEDQLVQKVMPKLRGIETRGRVGPTASTRSAPASSGKYDILPDFDLSCDFGYGQFIWQTSSFLQEPSPPPRAPEAVAADPSPAAGAAQATETSPVDDLPPENFMPGAPDRIPKWRKLNPAKRARYLAEQGKRE